MKGEIKLQLHPGVPLTASLQWEGVSGVRWGAFPADWQACLGVWTSRVLEEKLREMEKESMKLSDGTFSLHTCCARIYLWKYGILDCVLQSQHKMTFTSHFLSVMWQEIMHEESGRNSKSGQLWFHAELSVCVFLTSPLSLTCRVRHLDRVWWAWLAWNHLSKKVVTEISVFLWQVNHSCEEKTEAGRRIYYLY